VGRDALSGGVLRVVADHRTPEGRRVVAYMRGLVAPFIPSVLFWEAEAEKNGTPPRPPASVREQARTAGRLLLEEEALLAQVAGLQGRRKKARELRRLERRLLATRGMRLSIEKSLQDRAKRR
jgi:hypothetical protein